MKQEAVPPLLLEQVFSEGFLQLVIVSQDLHFNAHVPDKLRNRIIIEAFMLNDNAQLCIHESNLQAFYMSFILKIRANTI